jgi:hypothetical protein
LIQSENYKKVEKLSSTSRGNTAKAQRSYGKKFHNLKSATYKKRFKRLKLQITDYGGNLCGSTHFLSNLTDIINETPKCLKRRRKVGRGGGRMKRKSK